MQMCVPVYTETSITNYQVTRRHIKAVRILNAVDCIQDGTGGLEASMAQEELKKKILKEYL